MNKKYLIFGLPVLLIGLVAASVFYFDTLDIIFDVSEPFTVSYLVVPQGYHTDCDDLYYMMPYTELDGSTLDVNTITDFEDIYPGDDIRICFEIYSTADEEIPFSYTYSGDDTILDNREITFDGTSVLTGRAGVLYGQLLLEIADDADGSYSGTIRFGRGSDSVVL